MNTKKVIIFLAVLAVVAFGAYYFLSRQGNVTMRCEEGFRFVPSTGTCLPVGTDPDVENKIDFSEIEFNVPGSSVSLKLDQADGSTYSSSYTDPEFPTPGYVSIDSAEVVEYSTRLALLPFLHNSGGTGEFMYVALIDAGTNEHLASVFVGDRIGIESIESIGQIVKINYKTRLDSEGYAVVPTIPAQLVVEIRNMDFVELMRLQNADYNEVEMKSPTPNSSISDDFTLKGSVPGSWYFEAVAQYRILDGGLTEIAAGYVQALSDWMTTQRVPFEMRVQKSEVNYSGNATIIIESENVEGGDEGARKVKRLEIPVTFQ